MEKTISPLDNRYFSKINEISNYFSLKSWVYYRLYVEVEYLKKLISVLNMNEIPEFVLSGNQKISILTILNNLLEDYETSNDGYNKIMEIEKETKHDIKAIEYYIGNYIKNSVLFEPGLGKIINLIHYGLTSQDINSVAFSLQLKCCMKNAIIPSINKLVLNLFFMGIRWENIIMCGYTHGQHAVPTKLGKEIKVYSERLDYWIKKIRKHNYYTKMGGAVGNLSAHKFTIETINWEHFFKEFLNNYGLIRWNYTTQITNYDDIVQLFSLLIGMNYMLIDLCQDMWLYISHKYFKLTKSFGQVGSSTMPQKVNPIDFENAEGNLKLANSGFEFMVSKLQISRLQRDLTDSTVLRNVGTYLGHCLLAYKNIQTGLTKLEVNNKEIQKDLDSHPECLSEAIQMVLRRYNVDNGYDIIRRATQNKIYNNLEEFKESIKENLGENVNSYIIRKIDELNYDNYC